MRRPNRRRAILFGVAASGALAASALAAYAAADSASVSQSSPIQQLGGGPGQFARSYGLDAADAVAVFTLRDGQSVSVVASASAKCLIRGSGDESAETCDSTASIDEGQAISVLDECGTTGRNLMEITGLAPDDVATARLTWSDGNSEDTSVTHGAFRFDGINPAPGAPYPTGIAWFNGAGAGAGEAMFPVQGDQFCLPTS